MSTVTSYLEKYALVSLEKQEKLTRLIGEHAVETDTDTGMLRFPGIIEVPIQVLGTESDNTLTWLWAWADEQAEMPADLLKSSSKLKEWGMHEGIHEFIVPSVDINNVDGHVLSLIASEVCKASCYYKDPYDGGALFLLLFSDLINRQPSFDVAGLSRQFSHLVSFYQINHRNALLSYLHLKGLHFIEHGAVMSWELESGENVRAEFDRAGRLNSINGKTLSLD